MNAATEPTPVSFPTLDFGAVRVQSAAMSLQGARPYNEDRLGYTGDAGGAYWALADGLGGHKGGARAAELAVQAALQSIGRSAAQRLEDKLKQAVSDAHAGIRAEQKAHAEFSDMRSTLTLFAASAGDVAWSHCGDSRLYYFRSGKLAYRTRDHSAVQMLVAAGEVPEEEIPRHPGRSRLVSCLGSVNSLLISTRSGGAPPQPGDVFLLCSDGLWENFDTAVLERLVGAAADPEELLVTLDAGVAAVGRPDQDNYTVISVFIRG